MIRRWLPLIVLFSAALIYLACNFQSATKIIEKEMLLMGTIVRIKAPIGVGEDEKRTEEAIDEAFREIERVEDLFSVYKENSEISKINRLKMGEALKVKDEVFDLIARSVKCSEKTDGAFDITVKPLVDLWNSAKKKNMIPEDAEVKDALAKVGSQYIELDKKNRTISFKKEGMALDLGGIAKGYATDRAIKVLKEKGVRNAIVSSGGDMYCLGRRSKKELWKVGVQHPREKDRLYLEMRLEDRAIDTSGDYERYFVYGGKRYSHIIDPGTGYPTGDGVVSATVIADDPVTADMLATALSVLGKRGLGAIKEFGDVDAIMVFKEGDRLKTEMDEESRERYGIVEK